MASLGDILTTQKNGVVAINNIFQALSALNPTTTSATVTSSTLVITGSGRLISFSVVVAGSANGLIHNTGTPSGGTAANALVATPTTVGVYAANMVFTNGLVIAPGTGQSINVTYSQRSEEHTSELQSLRWV
jgi:hypothetical protein